MVGRARGMQLGVVGCKGVPDRPMCRNDWCPCFALHAWHLRWPGWAGTLLRCLPNVCPPPPGRHFCRRVTRVAWLSCLPRPFLAFTTPQAPASSRVHWPVAPGTDAADAVVPIPVRLKRWQSRAVEASMVVIGHVGLQGPILNSLRPTLPAATDAQSDSVLGASAYLGTKSKCLFMRNTVPCPVL